MVIEAEAVGSGYNRIVDEGTAQPVHRLCYKSSLHHPDC